VVLAASSHQPGLHVFARDGWADETAKAELERVEEGEATGVSEVRSYEGSVGRQRPRSHHHSGETQTRAARVSRRQHSRG
jgi:hypothetical protein